MHGILMDWVENLSCCHPLLLPLLKAIFLIRIIMMLRKTHPMHHEPAISEDFKPDLILHTIRAKTSLNMDLKLMADRPILTTKTLPIKHWIKIAIQRHYLDMYIIIKSLTGLYLIRACVCNSMQI